MKNKYVIIESIDFSCDIFVFGSNKHALSEHNTYKDSEERRNMLRNKTCEIYLIIHYIEFNLFGLKLLYTKSIY